MAIVENVGICRLGGFVGSKPEILGIFPVDYYNAEDQEEFIRKSLPIGIKPGKITQDKFKGNYILSYTFPLKNEENAETRDDLASITVVVAEKNVDIVNFKILFEVIVEHFGEHLKTFKKASLIQMMERIYNGVNKNKKINVEELVIDIPGIIKQKKLNIKKRTLEDTRGAFL